MRLQELLRFVIVRTSNAVGVGRELLTTEFR
jgi:hypothetical protein